MKANLLWCAMFLALAACGDAVSEQEEVGRVRDHLERVERELRAESFDPDRRKGLLREVSAVRKLAAEFMQRVESLERQIVSPLERAARERAFGSGVVFLERLVTGARHVEVQVIADGEGGAWALGVRDCSVQRRNQKVFEETPAPGLSADIRRRLHAAAVSLGKAVAYESAGTVEFIYDVERDDFYFLEVNTRLQAEADLAMYLDTRRQDEWAVRAALVNA